MMTAACGGHQGSELKGEYKLTVTIGPTTYWGMGADRFAELVKEKTQGRIHVKPYYSGSLVRGAQLKSAQMVASGVIDCAMESTINISPVIPEANLFALPFFINTFEKLDKIKSGSAGKAVFAAMEQKGLKPLAWGENGFRQLTNGKRRVGGPQDIKGLRLRVVGSPIFIETFKALGADPQTMNWGDAVTAFQQGVVDGQENPIGILIPVRIYEYHQHLCLWNYCVDPLILYWNKKQWDAFPEDIRRGILEAAGEAGRFETALSRAGLDTGESLRILREEFAFEMEVPAPLAFLRDQGMEVTVPTSEQFHAFREDVQPVYDKWVPRIGRDVVNSALADMK